MTSFVPIRRRGCRTVPAHDRRDREPRNSLFRSLRKAPFRGRPSRAYSVRRMSYVLVVDDEADVRKAFCRLLRALGYEARAADGGAAALDAMRAARPALVLLDLWMPE